MNETMKCPVCEEPGCVQTMSTSTHDATEWKEHYNCPRCGRFTLFAQNDLSLKYLADNQRAVLSHRIRRRQRAGSAPPLLLQSDLAQVDDPLPTPAEQADNLILWIRDHQPSPADFAEVPISEVSAWIGGAITPNDPGSALTWLLDQDAVKSLVERSVYGFLDTMEPMKLRLKMAGWQRYETLKRAQVESRTAFMAMQFGDSELNQVVNDYFKPAVEAAGFKLRVLTEGQPAGLIDDQLRVALRTARFVMADLTHGNNGAYWEAGFAEGLGRPVIYTCRKQEWKEGTPHFDTSHLNTIIWDPENLQDAATRLTATIRATLPAEAEMTD